MLDDFQLLQRFAAGSGEESFAELVRRHLPLVYAAALRRTDGDSALAQDIAQGVFNALARDAGKISPRAVLAGWLYVATRHAAANAVRAEKRRKKWEKEAQAMQELSPDSSASSAAGWDALRPVLDAAIDELDETDRNAVLMRFFEAQPWAEIGRALRLSENTARMRGDRALEKIRAGLAKRGINSTAAALAAVFAEQASAAVPAQLAATVSGTALAGLGGTGAAASAAGGAATFLTTMSLFKSAAVVAAALALFALGTAWHERQELALARANLAKSARLDDDLRSELRRSQSKLAAALTASKRAEPEGKNKMTRVATDKPKSTPGAGTMFRLRDIVRDHPEFTEFRKRLLRQNTLKNYVPVFAGLNLAPARLERLKDLLVERQYADGDARDAAIEAGLKENSPDYAQAVAAARAPAQAEIVAMLGADSAAQLDQAASGREAADQINLEMSDIGTGLTPSELVDVSRCIGQLQDSRQNGTNLANTPVDPASGLNAYDRALLEKASVALPPDKFATFQRAEIAEAQQRPISKRIWKLLPPGTSGLIDD